MNYRMIGKINAMCLGIEAVFMLPAMLLCVYDKDSVAATAFLKSIALTAAAALLLAGFSKKATRHFSARDGMVCVGLCWIIMSLLGCLPFYFSGSIPHFYDALFEIVSGFTTTGASVVADVESLARGILYWRSFSHWLGGMGVLVFVMAIVPLSGREGGFTMHILRAESPGPDVGKLMPRMKQTAMVLYLLYILLTVLNVIFLLIGGMPFFDALCTAFGTAGTGGFGIKNNSLAGYSPYIQNVCTVFMLLFGVNFSCYFLLICRRFKTFLRNEELRLYLGIALGSMVLVTVNIYGMYPSLGETVRHAVFQVSSIMTTTGFASTDFDLWPTFSKALLMCLMVVGACAGSTGGGFKCARILLLIKALVRNVHQALHPSKVQVIRVDGNAVDERVIANTNAYLSAYVIISIVSFLLISIDGMSVTTNLSAMLACFNNIGPGLDLVGPTCNYASYSVLSKMVLIIDMLAGRLEIFPILVLFTRSAWKR